MVQHRKWLAKWEWSSKWLTRICLVAFLAFALGERSRFWFFSLNDYLKLSIIIDSILLLILIAIRFWLHFVCCSDGIQCWDLELDRSLKWMIFDCEIVKMSSQRFFLRECPIAWAFLIQLPNGTQYWCQRCRSNQMVAVEAMGLINSDLSWGSLLVLIGTSSWELSWLID